MSRSGDKSVKHCHRDSELGLRGSQSRILREVSRSGTERGKLRCRMDERETTRAQKQDTERPGKTL